jgi:Uma2 family endonuclease
MVTSGLLGPAFGQLPPDDDIGYEIVNGQRVESPPMSADATVLASQLIIFAGPGARSVGRFATETLFVLDDENDLQRRPDIAFVSYQRWPKGRPVPSTSAWDVIPNLAVEVVSPTNLANEIVNKVHEYFRCGVEQVWVVYPVVEQVYVYTSPKAVRILGRDDELDGGALLPGFRLPLAELFERPEEAPAASG